MRDPLGKKKTPSTPSRGELHADNPEIFTYITEMLHIVILGGIHISGLDRLRVTLKVERSAHTHRLLVRRSLDLNHTRHVEQLTQKIVEPLDLATHTVAHTLAHLTSALEAYRTDRLAALKPKTPEAPTLTEAERRAALAYLKDPALLANTRRDITASGIVGETNNALIAYIAYTSGKREKPLHIMCLGASGTGKTYLQEKVAALIRQKTNSKSPP